MNTLDNIKHVEEVLKTKLGVSKIVTQPVVLTINELKKSNLGLYYFGVVTLGKNITSARFNLHGFDIIEIEANSQIILLFNRLDCDIVSDSKVPFAFGQFRGYRLIADNVNEAKLIAQQDLLNRS